LPEDAIARIRVRLGDQQLAALEELHRLLERHGIQYWLFGGWAVDFHAGTVTRPHDDLDLAVWLEDYDRIAALHTPLREGRGAWPDEAFADNVAELGGARARGSSVSARSEPTSSSLATTRA
jgi:Aminoglycoside-2''-adenylyltransferase